MFTRFWGGSSVGRALEWHSRGQGFDPPSLHWAERLFAVKGAPKLGRNAGVAQLVEHNLAKVGVAGSSPVSRLYMGRRVGAGLRACPQYGEHGGACPLIEGMGARAAHRGRLAQLVRAPR